MTRSNSLSPRPPSESHSCPLCVILRKSSSVMCSFGWNGCSTNELCVSVIPTEVINLTNITTHCHASSEGLSGRKGIDNCSCRLYGVVTLAAPASSWRRRTPGSSVRLSRCCRAPVAGTNKIGLKYPSIRERHPRPHHEGATTSLSLAPASISNHFDRPVTTGQWPASRPGLTFNTFI
jgi:hypothetical protein